jgi:hypothetical protein
VCCAYESIALAGLEAATFASSGKHTNHYTKATWKKKNMMMMMMTELTLSYLEFFFLRS